jgi:putative membrane protein
MILPGVSGGFLLLLLGQYVPILSAIDAVQTALAEGAPRSALEPAVAVLLPVGIGVLVGVVAVSNALRFLLGRHPQPTLGVLTGLLLGAVVGLWPFQQAVAPQPGERVKGRIVTQETLAEIDPDDYPTAYFAPSVPQGIVALALVAAGGAATVLVSRWGQSHKVATS